MGKIMAQEIIRTMEKTTDRIFLMEIKIQTIRNILVTIQERKQKIKIIHKAMVKIMDKIMHKAMAKITGR